MRASASTAILVTGHGQFASGLVSALELIMGPQTNLMAVDFPGTDTATELTEHLTSAMASLSTADQVAVFCDLRGGSPFNVATSLASDRDDVAVLFGVNLPTLMEFIGRRSRAAEVETLSTAAIAAGRDGLGRFALTTAQADDEGDWA
ncbi:MAG: PTS sugar transporter subunit IIA [Nocardioides sp.]